MSTFTVSPERDPAVFFVQEQTLGWPRVLAEVERRLELATGYAARDAEGRVVGTITLCVYERGGDDIAFAWIGGMGVAPAWRGRGVARALLDAALDGASCARAPVVGLDATEMGRPLYEKAGFQAVSQARRWRRTAGAARVRSGGGHSVHPISLSEVMEIAAYDAPRFGGKRLRWLLATMHQAPWNAFMSRARSTGEVTGFVLGQERHIGPLVADDEDVAAALLAAVELSGAPPAALVPEAHARLFEQAGWSPEGAPVTRMTKGGPPPGRPERIRAYGAWALG